MGGLKKGPPENENTLAETEGLEGAGNDRGCTERARASGASCETVMTLAGEHGGEGGQHGQGLGCGRVELRLCLEETLVTLATEDAIWCCNGVL